MHTNLAPAKIRIQEYRKKTFGKEYAKALDEISSRPKSSKLWGSRKERPQTSKPTTIKTELGPKMEAPSARIPSSISGQVSHGDLMTQASSKDINSRFEHKERAQSAHPFKTFYTTGDPVMFKTTNTFEGRSNYYHYYPTGNSDE